MKIDFSAPILGPNDTPIMEGGKPATLGSIASTALFATLPEDENATATDKALWGNLGLALYAEGKHDLTAEQIALVKKRIGRAFSSLAVARAFHLLDPRDEQ